MRLSARRLLPELLPFPRRLIILPVNHMRVDFLGRSYRPMPQACRHRRQWYAAGQQVRAVRVSERVQARALRQFEPAEQQRNRRRYGVGLGRVPSGLAKIKSKSAEGRRSSNSGAYGSTSLRKAGSSTPRINSFCPGFTPSLSIRERCE